MAETIIQAAIYILTVALGGLALWYKQSGRMKEWAAELILRAEEEYGELTNAGGKKFNEVVDWLYGLIPVVMRPFMPREFVGHLVQSVFDAMEDYARIQIDVARERSELEQQARRRMDGERERSAGSREAAV